MATVKLKFRISPKGDGKEGYIYYQIIHERVVKLISSGCKINREDWCDSRSFLRCSIVQKRGDNETINKWDRVRFEQRRLQEIANNNTSLTIEELVAQYKSYHKNRGLFGFSLETISKLKNMGNVSNAGNYYAMLTSFMTFRKGDDVELKSLDSDLLEAYEAHLKYKDGGSALNSISFYMRTLRAVYNRAVEKGFVKEQNIFKRVYTSIERTAKRAVSLSVVTKIKNADFESNPKLAFARDLFMFSFYTRGMSFVDIAYLKKSDIKNGEFTYRRCKTGQALRVKWEQCMDDIVSRNPNPNSEYLLPIIKDGAKDARQQYINARGSVNYNLKTIAEILEIPYNITMYVARHTWASAAKHKNISISIISEAMGHDSEMTTKIYLASLDTAVIDDANRLIIDSI